jgi:hypothetical protein
LVADTLPSGAPAAAAALHATSAAATPATTFVADTLPSGAPAAADAGSACDVEGYDAACAARREAARNRPFHLLFRV